jgi:hypothetical protein
MIAAAVASGGLATWIERRRAQGRAALPIIRRNGEMITIVNRLDEDIELIKIQATGDIDIRGPRYDHGGSVVPGSEEFNPSPVMCSLRIIAHGQKNMLLQVRPSSKPPRAWLTFSSSARTLRSKRIEVRMFTTLKIPRTAQMTAKDHS